MTISQIRAPFERGSKLVRKTVLTDSRFPGTTELLSAASVELKGVRANLEEQVRITFVSVSFNIKLGRYYSLGQANAKRALGLTLLRRPATSATATNTMAVKMEAIVARCFILSTS
jgi:hypothetical protein